MFPESLSPSRASDYLTCPLLYRLRVVDRLPEPPSGPALRGTLIHAALEKMFNAAPADRTADGLAQLFIEAYEDLVDRDVEAAAALHDGLAVSNPEDLAQAVLGNVRPLIDAYFTLEDPQRLEPLAKEELVSWKHPDGLALKGIIDRVDQSPNGLVRLVDYKTGRSPSAFLEAKSLFQMRFYALIWWRITGTIPTRLQLLYLGDGQTLHYEPTSSDLLATEKKILAIRDAIARSYQSEFTPSTSALCAYCSFHEQCPEQGGTTPPMPPIS